ncbi:AAA family ATPase [Crocinitomicaceae bacterium]|nr:AAA family ATPase [Crocinitomicaceae bacterium]
MTEHSPWVEKYRPTEFKDIVLDATNKKILTNVIEKQYFPNLLFYGPPGTGKTTTIINLIKLYQTKYSSTRKGFMIHLNASDDRGIDIIRNQISQFVKTKSLFGTGMKFVILDEVDYMTKNAQQALRSLIQQYSTNVRFCLICNYISRIDTALQNEFVRLRFCQLPKEKIFNFLNEIQKKESLNIDKETLVAIQYMFKSDIRSMINFLQSNHNPHANLLQENIITDSIWENLEILLKKGNVLNVLKYIKQRSAFYNIEVNIFLIKFIYYLTFNKEYAIKDEWIKLFKYITHHGMVNKDYLLNYSVKRLISLYKLL